MFEQEAWKNDTVIGAGDAVSEIPEDEPMTNSADPVTETASDIPVEEPASAEAAPEAEPELSPEEKEAAARKLVLELADSVCPKL